MDYLNMVVKPSVILAYENEGMDGAVRVAAEEIQVLNDANAVEFKIWFYDNYIAKGA